MLSEEPAVRPCHVMDEGKRVNDIERTVQEV
jgi:hypothetical protein